MEGNKENQKERLKILVLEDCKPCTDIIDRVKSTADIVDLNSDEGRKLLMDIVEKGNVDKLTDEPEDAQDVTRIKVPFGIDEDGNFCELFVSEDTILAKCGDELKVLYEKEEENG